MKDRMVVHVFSVAQVIAGNNCDRISSYPRGEGMGKSAVKRKRGKHTS